MPKIDYAKIIKEEVKKSLANKPNQSISHRFDHMERVWKRAKNITLLMEQRQPNIKIDKTALEIACYTHDIDEPFKGRKEDHVQLSMTEAAALMRRVGLPEDRINKVLLIISEHSSENIKTPTSIEAKILFDADKLDGLGPIGIARVFALCGQQGLSIAETVRWYKEKINKALPYMRTEIGKEIAEKQLKYVYSFLNKLEEEISTLEAI